ncbi:hypothetical protein Pla110_24150 [Polystyrenella longa]|uniref:DUF2071 domain-containing protein n=2 Tax=Polystyrenella longa TaxID=2528007 RepID=A0A518CN96_9PLAN|nr:hypothetical protein Pla110_24150 [Polystyrenella longa]
MPEFDRLAPTRRPNEKPVGFQAWKNLFFLHWTVPVEIIRAAVPAPLELDLYQGNAWLGIVPFQMRSVRPAWLPPVPGMSNFLETNVRTYVHYRGEPGVWFFSLDANATIATLVARYCWNLNYCRGRLTLKEQSDLFQWTGRRWWPGSEFGECGYDIQIELDPTQKEFQTAIAGSFEHFLVERYLLFTQTKAGRLLRGQVHHHPYRFQTVKAAHYTGTLEKPLALPALAETPDHTLFSPGVSVEMFKLSEV